MRRGKCQFDPAADRYSSDFTPTGCGKVQLFTQLRIFNYGHAPNQFRMSAEGQPVVQVRWTLNPDVGCQNEDGLDDLPAPF